MTESSHSAAVARWHALGFNTVSKGRRSFKRAMLREMARFYFSDGAKQYDLDDPGALAEELSRRLTVRAQAALMDLGGYTWPLPDAWRVTHTEEVGLLIEVVEVENHTARTNSDCWHRYLWLNEWLDGEAATGFIGYVDRSPKGAREILAMPYHLHAMGEDERGFYEARAVSLGASFVDWSAEHRAQNPTSYIDHTRDYLRALYEAAGDEA